MIEKSTILDWLKTNRRLSAVVFFFLWGALLVPISRYTHILLLTLLFLIFLHALAFSVFYIGFVKQKDEGRDKVGIVLGIIAITLTLIMDILFVL